MLVMEKGPRRVVVVSYEQNGHIEFLYTTPPFLRRFVASALYVRMESILAHTGATQLLQTQAWSRFPFLARGFHNVEGTILSWRCFFHALRHAQIYRALLF